jgi:hypothetical protein
VGSRESQERSYVRIVAFAFQIKDPKFSGGTAYGFKAMMLNLCSNLPHQQSFEFLECKLCGIGRLAWSPPVLFRATYDTTHGLDLAENPPLWVAAAERGAGANTILHKFSPLRDIVIASMISEQAMIITSLNVGSWNKCHGRRSLGSSGSALHNGKVQD